MKNLLSNHVSTLDRAMPEKFEDVDLVIRVADASKDEHFFMSRVYSRTFLVPFL